ncbi:TPA: Ail/Lom family outer membrane beta-barrel protein [Escherichia coli]|nr:Ail/Lom family outer membrane beta-barrel protein [Escherichia coli]
MTPPACFISASIMPASSASRSGDWRTDGFIVGVGYRF